MPGIAVYTLKLNSLYILDSFLTFLFQNVSIIDLSSFCSFLTKLLFIFLGLNYSTIIQSSKARNINSFCFIINSILLNLLSTAFRTNGSQSGVLRSPLAAAVCGNLLEIKILRPHFRSNTKLWRWRQQSVLICHTLKSEGQYSKLEVFNPRNPFRTKKYL